MICIILSKLKQYTALLLGPSLKNIWALLNLDAQAYTTVCRQIAMIFQPWQELSNVFLPLISWAWLFLWWWVGKHYYCFEGPPVYGPTSCTCWGTSLQVGPFSVPCLSPSQLCWSEKTKWVEERRDSDNWVCLVTTSIKGPGPTSTHVLWAQLPKVTTCLSRGPTCCWTNLPTAPNPYFKYLLVGNRVSNLYLKGWIPLFSQK